MNLLLYLNGCNGSGKTTALNVIAEKINAKRESVFNKTNFFPKYVEMCEIKGKIPKNSSTITSDDVFDYMLNIRTINDGIDQKRGEIFEEFLDAKYSKFQMRSMDDYEQLNKMVRARSLTQSKYVREELINNIHELSNGESAFKYFTEKLTGDGLYILDEPENSLSPKRQIELAQFIEDSARFYNCQIIMSTHSPFLLALKNAKIYNLDENPSVVRRWSELENIRVYHEFFEKHRGELLTDTHA